jgi:hypothetical protein
MIIKNVYGAAAFCLISIGSAIAGDLDYSKPIFTRANAVLCPAVRVLPQGTQHSAQMLLLIELGPGGLTDVQWHAVLAADGCRIMPAGVKLQNTTDESATAMGVLTHYNGDAFMAGEEGLTNQATGAAPFVGKLPR